MNSELCSMEPGAEIYEPARYALRIWNNESTIAPVILLHTSTPYPRYEVGDRLHTTHWPLGQEGRSVTVESVDHNLWSLGDQVYFVQDVYCRFPLPILDTRPNPRV